MKWDNHKSGSQSSWSYWPGTWQNGWKKDRYKNPGQQETQSLLVPYDKVKVEQKAFKDAEGSQASNPIAGAPGEDTLVRDLQNCVNQARKAEGRVKKLVQDRQQRLAQWNQYERNVRAEFLKERARHQQDVEQIEAELGRAVQAQEAARAKVRAAAQGSETKSSAAIPGEDEYDPCMDRIAGWEEDSPKDDAALQQVLERAMQGAKMVVPQTGTANSSNAMMMTPPASGNPRTPCARTGQSMSSVVQGRPGTGSRLQPFPPPKRPRIGGGEYQAMELDAHVLTDPYVGTGLSPGMDGAPLASPLLGGPKTPHVRRTGAATVGGEPACMPGMSSAVQQQLERKRVTAVAQHSSPHHAAAVAAGCRQPVQFQIDSDDGLPTDPGGLGSADMD